MEVVSMEASTFEAMMAGFESGGNLVQTARRETSSGVARQSGCMWDSGYIKTHLTNLPGQRNAGVLPNRAQDVLQERGCEDIDG